MSSGEQKQSSDRDDQQDPPEVSRRPVAGHTTATVPLHSHVVPSSIEIALASEIETYVPPALPTPASDPGPYREAYELGPEVQPQVVPDVAAAFEREPAETPRKMVEIPVSVIVLSLLLALGIWVIVTKPTSSKDQARVDALLTLVARADAAAKQGHRTAAIAQYMAFINAASKTGGGSGKLLAAVDKAKAQVAKLRAEETTQGK